MATSVLRLLGVAFGVLLAAGATDHGARLSVLAQEPLPDASFSQPFNLGGDDIPDMVAGQTSGGLVNVFSGADLSLLAAGSPFGAGFTGGIHVAAGDITGDGVTDVVTAMASAGGRVRAYDGATLSILADFAPFGSGFAGGVSVALGDINGDGRADLIVGPASGAGPVRAYNANGTLLGSGSPFGNDAGGVFVAAGDVNADGFADVVVAQARGGLVSVFSGNGFSLVGSGAPYGPAFTGGVSVAVGDVNGDGRADVITAPASGAGPVRAYDVATVGILSSGQPFGAAYAGGMRVASSDFDGDGHDDVVVSGGAGSAHVRVFSGATQAVLADFLAFGLGSPGGAYVAAPARTGIRFTSPATATFAVGSAGSFTIRTQGTPPVTTITQAGPLPAGLAFTDNGDGTARIAGTPDPGTGQSYTLTLTASNGTTRTATQTLTVRVEEAPAFTSPAVSTFRVGQASSFEVVTRGFPVPDLTLTGALPSGLTFTDLDTGRATIAGSPAAGTGGSYPLTLSAANGVGAVATQSFTLTVETGAVITSPDTASFIVGTPTTFTITTTGEPPVTTIGRTGTLPSGLTYTDNGDGTATLSGTAAPGSGGTYPQTLTATNGVGAPAVQVLTITVQQGPQITSPASTTFVAGTAGSFMVVATGAPVPSLAVAGALPAGVTFVDNGNGTGTLAGTATAGGTFPLTFTATNGVGAPATQPFTLTVQQPPAITSAAGTTFNVASAGSFTITSTGVPTPTVALTAGTLPTGVTFTPGAGGTALLAGTPAGGTSGTYPLTITASNGVGADAVQSFTLLVQAPPAITSAASTTFTVGAASTFTVMTTGTPAPTLSMTGALPTGVGFTPGTGELAGTPTQTGTFAAIQFTAANGVPPDAVQDFTLTVSCPVITVSATPLPDGSFNTAYGPVTFTASGSTGATLTWVATGLPTGISIGSTSGAVAGTPSTTVLNAAVGITVTDEFGCAGVLNTTFTVRPSAVDNGFINGVGNTQFVVGATPPATPHVFVSGSVLANDAGPGALSATIATPPTQGALVLNADGTFVYTPAAGALGGDSFGYTLTDGNGVTDTATVTIAMSGMVWYVNNNGANGDGRSHNPFNALNNASAPSTPGQSIFVHSGTGTTPGALALKDGQTLWGQGALFTLNGLTIPAGVRPSLSGTVTLANTTAIGGVGFQTSGVPAINDPAGAVTGVTIGNGVAVTTVNAPGLVLSDAAGTFSFERISVLGGPNGISLTNLTGPFTVTGTGTPTSGGAMQNITGDAIRLSNTSSLVSLSYMGFQGIGDMAGPIDTVSNHQAIRGENVLGGLALNNVTMNQLSDHAILGSQFASPGTPTVWNGLTITNSTIEDSNRFHLAGIGDGGNEAMVRILGLRGAVNVSGSTLRRGNEPMDLLVNGGTLTMTITASSFQAYKEDITGGSQPTVGQHCVDVVVQGAATASVTIGDRSNAALGNTFLNCRLASVRVLHDTAATGTVDAVIARNTFTVDDHSSPAGSDFFFPMGGVLGRSLGAAGSSMNVLALGNQFNEVTNASGGVGQLTLSAEGGTFRARVDGNTFAVPGNAPWFIRATQTQAIVEMRNNTVVGGFFTCPDPSCGGGYNAPGIRAIADAQNGGQLDLTVTNDTFAQHDTAFDPGNTVEIQANTSVGAPPLVCAALASNRSPDGYALEQAAGTFNLSRGSSSEPAATCTAGAPGACQNVLTANGNTGGAGVPTTTPPQTSIAGTITLTSAACQLPSGGIFQP